MLTLGLAQTNPIVGDLTGNAELIKSSITQARERGVQVLLFPELMISGYPPEDLLQRRSFLADCRSILEQIAKEATGIVVLVGFPERDGRNPYNSLAVLADGAIQAVYRKVHLPTYGVFDEDRVFAAGSGGAMIKVNGHLVGLSICEDIWYDQPTADMALAGAELILNLSASPYEAGKSQRRQGLLAQHARNHLVSIAYCNLVGGQDELVFDGQSMVIDHRGRVLAQAPQFREDLLVAEIDLEPVVGARLHDTRGRGATPERPVPLLAEITVEPTAAAVASEPAVTELLDPFPEVYGALVLGLRDYVTKNRFKRVLLGLSGGIDSALVALLAVDALGAENVTCVVMPSCYSADATQSDARIMADRLGCQLYELPIGDTVKAYDTALSEAFAGQAPDITEENIQARIRGNFLMALSNKFGWMLLSTGNKSEMSVGYSTLYGDLSGGLSVIKDVPKTLVYDLTAWRNAQAPKGELPPCPETIITRPPSAELSPDQKDTDSLPPYDILDDILGRYVEDDESVADIVRAGHDIDTVERIVKLVNIAEYKRRQAPPGIKVTARAFGRGRRVPITNRYEELKQKNPG